MPQSNDDTLNLESDNTRPIDILDKASRKKAKKKSKKSVHRGGEEEERAAGDKYATDLLDLPSLPDDHYLSSSPEGLISDPEQSSAPRSYARSSPLAIVQDVSDLEHFEAVSEDTSDVQVRNGDDDILEFARQTIDTPWQEHKQPEVKLSSEFSSPADEPVNEVRRPKDVPAESSPSASPAPAPAPTPALGKMEPKTPSTVRGIPTRPPIAKRNSRISTTNNAPLPHMPQRHFSRVPDSGCGLNRDSQVLPGALDLCCKFDTFEGALSGDTDPAYNVILIGSEGGLDICRFNRQRRDVIGRLEGLRGRVVDAKILPCPPGDDPFAAHRPLIACIVHGPAPVRDDGDASHISPFVGQNHDTLSGSQIPNYQTSVEVYSIKHSQHVMTLFSGLENDAQYPPNHRLFTPPPAEGDLSIDAQGEFVILTSGISGEIYIFALSPSIAGSVSTGFRCIGKLWTRVKSLQRFPQVPDGMPNDNGEPVERCGLPVYSLSQRWLAISPPMLSSSQKSFEGAVCTQRDRNNGVDPKDYVSPPPPAVDCEIDAPNGNGLFNRVTKQATQEIRKGAQWVGEQGLSMIKNYWNRPPSSGEVPPVQVGRKSSPEEIASFPPTHGHNRENSAVKIEPSLVSIVDLQKLLQCDEGKTKTSQVPLATFHLADGCSFLSFSPNGLALLTTNQVGDTSTIWDLMRITDTKAALSLPTMIGGGSTHVTGLVRRLTTLARMSPSSVVDIRWTLQGNRIGILTEKGTVHLHELPRYDFLASALRSPASPARPRSGLPSPSTSPQELPPSGWMTNVRSGWQNVQGRISAVRQPSENGGFVNSTRQSLGQAGIAARYAGGRVVRNGYNQALEGAYSLRHAQDNKIRLKAINHAVKAGSFRWLRGKEEGLVATIADAVLSIYTVKSNFHTQGRRTIIVLDASRKAGQDQPLPPVSAALPHASDISASRANGRDECSDGVHGFWTLDRQGPARPFSNGNAPPSPSAATQDKETCPQFTPLHRHRQVDLFTYDDKLPSSTIAQSLGLTTDSADEAWLFGGPIPRATRVTAQRFGAEQWVSHQDRDDRGVEGIVGHMEDDFDADDVQTVVGGGSQTRLEPGLEGDLLHM